MDSSNSWHIQVKSFPVLAMLVDRCTLVPPCVVTFDRLDDHPGTSRLPFVIHQLYKFGDTKKITCYEATLFLRQLDECFFLCVCDIYKRQGRSKFD